MELVNYKKRDSLGLIELDNIKLKNINYTRPGKYNNFAFTVKGKKYFFKRCASITSIYNELIAEEIAKEYGIKCAHYDLASYNGMVGTISQDISEDCDNFYLLSEIIDDDRNNINDIILTLQQKYKNPNIINTLKKELIDIFTFDILIANHDRHPENLAIIEKNNEVHFSPVFDNELMLDYRSIFNGEYRLGINNTSTENSILEEITSPENDIYYNNLINNLSLITFEKIINYINIVETKIECKINPYIKNNIYDGFKDNYKSIENIKSQKQEKIYIKEF